MSVEEMSFGARGEAEDATMLSSSPLISQAVGVAVMLPVGQNRPNQPYCATDRQLGIARIPARLGKTYISRQQGSSRNVRAKLSLLTLYLAIQCHVFSIVISTSSQHKE